MKSQLIIIGLICLISLNQLAAQKPTVSGGANQVKEGVLQIGSAVGAAASDAADAVANKANQAANAVKDTFDTCQCVNQDFSKVKKGTPADKHSVESRTRIQNALCQCSEDCNCPQLNQILRRFARLSVNKKNKSAKRLLASLKNNNYDGTFQNGDKCVCDQTTINRIKNKYQEARKGFFNGVKDAKAAAEFLVQSAKRGVKGAADAAKQLANSAAQAVQNAGNAVVSGAKQAGQAASNALANAADIASQLGNKAVNKVANLADKAGKLADKAVDKANQLAQQAVDSSRQVAGKIMDKAQKFADNAGKLADKALDKANQLAGQAGDAAKAAAEKAKELANKASSAVSGAIGGVGEMLAGECIPDAGATYAENPKDRSGPWVVQGTQSRSKGLCSRAEECVCQKDSKVDNVKSQYKESKKECVCKLTLAQRGSNMVSGITGSFTGLFGKKGSRFVKRAYVQIKAYCNTLAKDQCLEQKACQMKSSKCTVSKAIRRIRFAKVRKSQKKFKMNRNNLRFKQIILTGN